MTRRWVTCLLLILFTVACGTSDSPPAGREILVIGTLGPLQADSSVVGMIHGVEIAVQEYNSNPDSRYEIELRQLDTKGTDEGAEAAAGEIVKTERLVGVIGPFTDAEAAAAGPVFEEASIPFMIPSVADTSIPPPGMAFRRLCANDRQEGQVLAQIAAQRVSGAISLMRDDSGRGSSFETGVKETLDALKRPLSRTEVIEEEQNLGQLALSITQSPPEAILYGGPGDRGKAFIEALRAAGFNGLFVGSHQVRDQNPNGVGAGVIGGSLAANPSDSFVRDYRQRFSTSPTAFSLEAYEGAVMILEAIEEVEADAEAVTEFLQRNLRFLGDSKFYEFAPSGELAKPVLWIHESTQGGWRLVGRSDTIAAPARKP